MDVFTLYVGQGALAAVRSGDDAVIIDAYMPSTDDVTSEQIEESLTAYIGTRRLRGLVLTGFDADHAPPSGVDFILTKHEPDWIMYPKYYKDTDCTDELFSTIDRHERRRSRTSRPLIRHSIRLDKLESRHLARLSDSFAFEVFSPHVEDMDSSNNSSIVLKIAGLDDTGFTYLNGGDTEAERWAKINEFFGVHLRSDVMAAPHHGSKTGVNAETLLHVQPDTVLISAGIQNQYGHPDSVAVRAFSAIAKSVFSTNAIPGGTCLFTRRTLVGFDTRLVRHPSRRLS